MRSPTLVVTERRQAGNGQSGEFEGFEFHFLCLFEFKFLLLAKGVFADGMSKREECDSTRAGSLLSDDLLKNSGFLSIVGGKQSYYLGVTLSTDSCTWVI